MHDTSKLIVWYGLLTEPDFLCLRPPLFLSLPLSFPYLTLKKSFITPTIFDFDKSSSISMWYKISISLVAKWFYCLLTQAASLFDSWSSLFFPSNHLSQLADFLKILYRAHNSRVWQNLLYLYLSSITLLFRLLL